MRNPNKVRLNDNGLFDGFIIAGGIMFAYVVGILTLAILFNS